VTNKKENEMALQKAEIRMIRWMCRLRLRDNAALRQRLETEDIADLVQQNRLR